MTGNWPELSGDLNVMPSDLRAGPPDVMKAFSAMAQWALAPKALDRDRFHSRHSINHVTGTPGYRATSLR